MAIGKQIERQLARIGWSQSRLAREAGLPQSTVNSIIRKDPRMTPHLGLLATTLRVSPAVLTETDEEADFSPSGPLALTPSEAAWVEIYRALDERSRSALMHIASTMILGPQSTVNSPRTSFKGETN